MLSQNSATLIDNIFTNNIDTIDKDRQEILRTDIMDHFPIFYMNSCHKQRVSNELHICRRHFCYDNKLSIQTELPKTDWFEMYLQCDNVQCTFSAFHWRFVDLLERNFPHRKINRHMIIESTGLLSPLLSQFIRKNRLYARYKCIKSTYNQCRYKS